MTSHIRKEPSERYGIILKHEPATQPMSKPRIEDPDRLRRFLEAVSALNWNGDSSDALKSTFAALDSLVLDEIIFYYRARKKQRFFSVSTRGLALALLTAGVGAPLLVGADPGTFKWLQPYGYSLLAAAGAVLMANRMFGATGGHIRYVTAQLELERLLTKYRLSWFELLAQKSPMPFKSIDSDKAFILMNNFVDAVFAVIQQETILWGKSVQERLDQFERRAPFPGQNSNSPD